MRIEQPWLSAPSTRVVFEALQGDEGEFYFVGGCVRNALLGAPVSDLDVATNLHPERILALAEKAGLRVVPTGIAHGTVTVVADGVPFEVTTFRRDVATDGRRAVVAFSDSILEDARRRDFTMNALYARPDGTIVDPLGGLDDLLRRRVRFIGDGVERIREDYLRILRYFRFFAWYGDTSQGVDPDALAAIADTQDGLQKLSRERVGAELVKLLSAPDPGPAIAVMQQIGVLQRVLPGADDRALAPLVHFEAPDATPELRFAALTDSDLSATLRLSKAFAQKTFLLRELAIGTMGAPELSYRHGAHIARQAMTLRSALLETPPAAELSAQIELGALAAFPVKARDLPPEYQGAAIGERLRQLEAAWISSNFTLSRQELASMD